MDTIRELTDGIGVNGFVVGVSGQPSELRFAQYRRANFAHYVILSNDWSADEALWFERELQTQCKKDKYRYNEKHRFDVHRMSLGGRQFDSYHVYLAWH